MCVRRISAVWMVPVILLTGISGPLAAQTSPVFGFKAAFTRSMFEIESFPNFSAWRSGLNAAVFAEKPLTRLMSVTVQFEYAQKGYLDKQVETDVNGSEIQDVIANTRLDYLSLPVFFKVKYPARKISPYLAIGPRCDYMINARQGEFHFTSVTVTNGFSNHLKTFAFGGSAVFGVEMPLFRGSVLSLEFRQNRDLTDSAKSPVIYSVKNKSADIWLGFTF